MVLPLSAPERCSGARRFCCTQQPASGQSPFAHPLPSPHHHDAAHRARQQPAAPSFIFVHLHACRRDWSFFFLAGSSSPALLADGQLLCVSVPVVLLVLLVFPVFLVPVCRPACICSSASCVILTCPSPLHPRVCTPPYLLWPPPPAHSVSCVLCSAILHVARPPLPPLPPPLPQASILQLFSRTLSSAFLQVIFYLFSAFPSAVLFSVPSASLGGQPHHSLSACHPPLAATPIADLPPPPV